MGSNFCDHTKLGFKDAAALEKAHKTVDLKYLRQTNRMAVRIFHDAVFEHPTKETAARTKLHSILHCKRVFITNVKGTFFGMSESEEASKRR